MERRSVPTTVAVIAILLCACLVGCSELVFQMAAGSGKSLAAGGMVECALEPPLRLAWTAKLDAAPIGGPILHGTALLQLTTEPSLYAFDSSTGHLLGRRRYDEPICTAPTGTDSIFTFFLTGDRSKLRAEHLVSGRLLWSRDLASCLAPAARSDTLLVALDEGSLRAFYIADGEVIWKTELGERLRTSPVLGDGIALVGSDNGLAAIDLNTGVVRWRHRMGAGGRTVPLMVDELAVVANGEGVIAALSMENGSPIWQQQIDGLPSWSMAYSGNKVFVGSSDRGIYALELYSGEINWRFESEGVFAAGPTATEETVYCAGSDRYLYAINRDTGQVFWKYRLDAQVRTPVLVGANIVVVASDKKTFYAFAKQ